MKRDISFHRDRAEKFVAGLSFQDKMKILYGTFEDMVELGLFFICFTGEAAHGVQARHDQSFDLGEPVCTTVFSNPIGMAASFDKELMHSVGNVVGTEMRSLANEFRHNGLLSFAPTVDMERDPRWGRNEEAYGEDPHLTSRMAGEYILGMAGDNEKYVRCGATLKHFYGNNVEQDRYSIDSVMPEDLQEDYYQRVFKETIEYAQPLSVMTSYNRINGVTATFNPEVKQLLRKWGVPLIVSDAFTLERAVTGHHTAKDGVDAIRKAFDAGVDYFLEEREFEKPAMEEALEKGVVTESDLDVVLINRLTVYSMLGLMKEDLNETDGSSKAFPKSEYNISKVDSSESRELARKAAAEAVVLLKNDGLLPLGTDGSTANAPEVKLFGPFVDRCPMDWYGGLSSHTVTIKEAMEAPSESLYPQVKIRLTDESKPGYAGIVDGRMVPVEPDEAEVFEIMLWDDSQITIRSMSTGKLLTTISPDKKYVNVVNEEGTFEIYANADDAFSWFVNEAFQLIDESGEVIHFSEDTALNFWEDPKIKGMKNYDGSIRISFETVKTVPDILKETTGNLKDKCHIPVMACFGLHPIVNNKEERDRNSIELPPFQRAELRLLRQYFDNIVLVLMANAPVAVLEESEAPEIKSILWSAFGSEEMGNGLADIILGRKSPSGRLPQTWYRGDYQLPDINDYDIRKNGMTYLYMTDSPLYRFGYGLTYSNFEAELIQDDTGIKASIRNVGEVISDYVVQLYQSPEGRYYLYGDSRDGLDVNGEKIPVGSRLVAFERVHDIKPGEGVIVDSINF